MLCYVHVVCVLCCYFNIVLTYNASLTVMCPARNAHVRYVRDVTCAIRL